MIDGFRLALPTPLLLLAGRQITLVLLQLLNNTNNYIFSIHRNISKRKIPLPIRPWEIRDTSPLIRIWKWFICKRYDVNNPHLVVSNSSLNWVSRSVLIFCWSERNSWCNCNSFLIHTVISLSIVPSQSSQREVSLCSVDSPWANVSVDPWSSSSFDHPVANFLLHLPSAKLNGRSIAFES